MGISNNTKGVLRVDRLYMAGNGRIHCGQLHCAGSCAFFTGRDLSGGKLVAIDDKAADFLFRELGRVVCEGCGRAHQFNDGGTLPPAKTIDEWATQLMLSIAKKGGDVVGFTALIPQALTGGGRDEYWLDVRVSEGFKAWTFVDEPGGIVRGTQNPFPHNAVCWTWSLRKGDRPAREVATGGPLTQTECVEHAAAALKKALNPMVKESKENTPEARAAFMQSVLTREKAEALGALYDRYQDEKEHEDWFDYQTAIYKLLSADLPKGVMVLKITKRPFGAVLVIDGWPNHVAVKANASAVAWKMIRGAK